MKNRILLISLAVVLALGVSLVACGGPLPPAAPEKIIVGAPRDINEALSFFECNAAGPLYRWWVDKTNAEGGIYLSKYDEKVEIEVVVRDFSLAEWDLAAVTEQLITVDKADFIFGGPGTPTIYTIAPVCDTYATLFITLEGGASYMIWDELIDGWPYTWISLSFANWYEMPVMQNIMDAVVEGSPTAYVAYINDTHGWEYRDACINEFGAANVLPAGTPPGQPHPYFITQDEANTIIAQAKDALGDPANPNYDIFMGLTYPWNVAALTIACINLDFNPPAIVFGPGANFGNYQSVYFGPNAEGICFWTIANQKTVPNVGTPSMSMADMFAALADQIEKDWTTVDYCPKPEGVTSGEQLLDYWGAPCYAAALDMWKAAVEEAGELDSLKVRNALAAFSPDNPAQTVYGDTWYRVFGDGLGGGIMDYLCHTGEVGQWQKGVAEVIGYPAIRSELPNYDVTADFIYPMTGKWGWLAS